ncbi:MAG: hypothetical protein ABJA87_07120 [bacterium]
MAESVDRPTPGLGPPPDAVAGRDSSVAPGPTVLVAVATTVANLLGYAFNAVMSRTLGVAGYGELASLLAVVVVATVAGTALQAVIARRLSAHGDAAGLVPTILLVATVVTVVTAALSPLLKAFLDIGTYPPVWWTAAFLLPTTLAFGGQGLLQGAGRFRAFGALVVAVQLARLVGGVVAAVTGTGTSVALAVGTGTTLLVVSVAAPLVLPPGRLGRAGVGRFGAALLRDVARDITPILGVLVLSNLDLLLARHYLSDHDSGLYAAGNLVTRAAFWGPAFVILVTYPRLAVPEYRAAALRHGTRWLVIIAVVGLAASVVAAGTVPLLLGAEYGQVSHLVWLFAAAGLALVGTQFAVFAGLAVHDRRLGRVVWLAVAAECAVVALGAHHSIQQIITTALGCGLALLAVSVLVELRRPVVAALVVTPPVS